MKSFSYGLIVPGEGRMGSIGMRYEAAPLASLPAAPPQAIRTLPPSSEWVNVRALGVEGDGTSDDTAAMEQAINTHSVLYLPGGHYVVRDKLRLKPDMC